MSDASATFIDAPHPAVAWGNSLSGPEAWVRYGALHSLGRWHALALHAAIDQVRAIGWLSPDERVAARSCFVSLKRWREQIWPMLVDFGFWIDDNGKRLCRGIESYADTRARDVRNGRAGSSRRWKPEVHEGGLSDKPPNEAPPDIGGLSEKPANSPPNSVAPLPETGASLARAGAHTLSDSSLTESQESPGECVLGEGCGEGPAGAERIAPLPADAPESAPPNAAEGIGGASSPPGGDQAHLHLPPVPAPGDRVDQAIGKELAEMLGRGGPLTQKEYQLIREWLAAGASAELIIEQVREVMGRDSRPPNPNLRYFHSVIGQAIAKGATPARTLAADPATRPAVDDPLSARLGPLWAAWTADRAGPMPPSAAGFRERCAAGWPAERWLTVLEAWHAAGRSGRVRVPDLTLHGADPSRFAHELRAAEADLAALSERRAMRA